MEPAPGQPSPADAGSDDDIEIVELPEPGSGGVSLARALLNGDVGSDRDEDDDEQGGGGGSGHAVTGKPGGGDGMEEATDDDDGDDDDDEPEKDHAAILAEVFSRPLVHYERTNPLVRDRGTLGSPTKVSAPFNKVLIATPTGSRKTERELDTLGESLMIFTPPSAEQQPRARLYTVVLLLLIPIDVLLMCLILEKALGRTEVYSGERTAHYLWFACSVCALGIGLAALKLKDTRFATLFATVYLVDALLNLVRVTTALHFMHFLFQLAIVHCVSQFKSTLLPRWFPPVRI